MERPRASGILLHPTSLPGRFGIGELGPEALRFVDFLSAGGQRLWQVLPLGPTGYGDSPYQCFSAFAGNPLLVSLDVLEAEGLLAPADLADVPPFPEREVDFGPVIDFKRPLLTRAFERFRDGADAAQREAFQGFCQAQAAWLDDFALFMAVKAAHGGVAWTDWDREIAARRPEALERWRRERTEEIEGVRFTQFLFFRQWSELRRHCHARHIRIMGDVPIFVAHDSADVWAHPELFRLDDEGRPTVVAGVPPDYFSATGQLWGNPLYRWDELARTGYAWWIARVRSTLSLVDLIRLDHFRGFEAYWEIPASAPTAATGQWVKGPGADLFEALRADLGTLPIVAENLGVITPEVEGLRARFGFPGMAILQFAFGGDPQGSDFIPHNYPRDRVVYTGTHDNDTVVGWWTSGVGESTRTAEEVEAEREFAKRYLHSDGQEIHWDFIRALLGSVAELAIVPLQDVLGLGSEARMNVPARPGGNWRWRVTADAVTPEIRRRLREMTEDYGRVERKRKTRRKPKE
jgi:4-alpha-glucanotransferase